MPLNHIKHVGLVVSRKLALHKLSCAYTKHTTILCDGIHAETNATFPKLCHAATTSDARFKQRRFKNQLVKKQRFKKQRVKNQRVKNQQFKQWRVKNQRVKNQRVKQWRVKWVKQQRRSPQTWDSRRRPTPPWTN